MVELVQIILVLRDELRMRRRSALHTVPDVEHHETVVPPRAVQNPVADIDVVKVPAAVLRAWRLPFADLPGMQRIVDVDYVHHTSRVVGEIHVRAELRLRVGEGRVHAPRHTLGKLAHRLRVQRVARIGDDNAVLAIGRALAREHHVVAVRGGHHVVHQARVGLDGVDDDWLTRIRDVDRVHAIAPTVRAKVGDLSIRMDPDFARGKRRPRQTTDHAHRTPDVPRIDLHNGITRTRAEARRDHVRPRFIGDECTIRVELPPARREAPGGRQPGERIARRIRCRRAEPHDVPRARSQLARRDLDARDGVCHDLHRRACTRRRVSRTDRRRARRDRDQDAVRVNSQDARRTRCPPDRIRLPAVVDFRVDGGSCASALARDERPGQRVDAQTRRRIGDHLDLEPMHERLEPGDERDDGAGNLPRASRNHPAGRIDGAGIGGGGRESQVRIHDRVATRVIGDCRETNGIAGRDNKPARTQRNAHDGRRLQCRHLFVRDLALRKQQEGGDCDDHAEGEVSVGHHARVAGARQTCVSHSATSNVYYSPVQRFSPN